MPNQQTYIKQVHLSGYKSIKNVNCEFEEGLNIVIGNNGSGKSNLLKFIDKILTRYYSELDIFSADIKILKGSNFVRSQNLVDDNKEYFLWHSEGDISKNTSDFENQNGNILEPSSDIFFYTEFIEFNLPEKIGVLSSELNSKFSLENLILLFNIGEENIPLIIAVWLRRIFKEDDNAKEALLLGEADNYVYTKLNSTFDNDYEDLKNDLSKYTPVQNIRFSNSVRVVKIDASTLEFRNIVFEFKVNEDWFSWEALSDGTKRLIYLIFTIHGLNYDKTEKLNGFSPISLIEEPELGIHPHQLHLLLNYLKEKSREQQIIITTHSPQVLDILTSNELNKIIIAEIDFENGTILRRLNNEELQKAQSYLKDEGLLSDYWRFSDLQRSNKVK